MRTARPAELDRLATAYTAACADEAVTAWATPGHDAEFSTLFNDWPARTLRETRS